MGTDLVYQPDFDGVAIGRLLSQWRTKPRIKALVQAMAVGVQTLEDDAFDVHVSTQFAAAAGDALDKWGEFVGESRGELDDSDYRVFIAARIMVNNSIGAIAPILDVWATVVAPYLEINMRRYQPLTYTLDVLRSTPMSDARALRVGQIMREIKPGGVAMMLVESTPGYYGFDEDPDSLGLDLGALSRNL